MTEQAEQGPDEIVYWRWLAHQHRDQLHRCVKLPWRGRQLALCARCLAAYPLLAITLVSLLLIRLRPMGSFDYLWVLGASAPAIADWGISRLGARGSNGRRLLTGALLGIALGRSFSLYLAENRSEVFWIHALVVVIAVLAFEIVRAFDLGDF